MFTFLLDPHSTLYRKGRAGHDLQDRVFFRFTSQVNNYLQVG